MSANSTNGFSSSLNRVSGALLLQRNDPFVGQRRGIAERRTDGFARIHLWSHVGGLTSVVVAFGPLNLSAGRQLARQQRARNRPFGAHIALIHTDSCRFR